MTKGVIQKNWYEIQAPDIFTKDTVAETPSDTESKVTGRTVKESLTELMDSSEKYYVDVTLKITEVEGNKAFSKIQGMRCSSEFVSRTVRKRSDRLDVVHDTQTKDGTEVRIKVIGATLKKTSSNTLNSVRNTITQILDEKAKEQEYNELMENIFLDNIQEDLRDEVNQIYPFRELEIRATELLE